MRNKAPSPGRPTDHPLEGALSEIAQPLLVETGLGFVPLPVELDELLVAPPAPLVPGIG